MKQYIIFFCQVGALYGEYKSQVVWTPTGASFQPNGRKCKQNYKNPEFSKIRQLCVKLSLPIRIFTDNVYDGNK